MHCGVFIYILQQEFPIQHSNKCAGVEVTEGKENLGIQLYSLDSTVINNIFSFLQLEYYTDSPEVPPHK